MTGGRIMRAGRRMGGSTEVRRALEGWLEGRGGGERGI